MNVVSMAINNMFVGSIIGVTFVKVLLSGYFAKTTSTVTTVVAVFIVSIGMATPGGIMVVSNTPITDKTLSFMLGGLLLLILGVIVFVAAETFRDRLEGVATDIKTGIDGKVFPTMAALMDSVPENRRR